MFNSSATKTDRDESDKTAEQEVYTYPLYLAGQFRNIESKSRVNM